MVTKGSRTLDLGKICICALLSVVCMSPVLFAAGAKEAPVQEEAEQIVLRYGDLISDSHPMFMAATVFANRLEEKSGGRIKVELYPSGQLGDQKTQIQAVQMGAQDMYRGNPAILSEYGVKKMAVLELPNIFRNVEHAWNVLRGPIGKELLEAIDNSNIGVIGLGFYTESPRCFFFRNKTVTKLADMKGLKIRVPESAMYMDMVRAFGASPTPISYSELYSALQTGVVDGAENALAGYESNKFYEVAPEFTFNGHMASPYPTIFSEVRWKTLSAADQELIRECWKESEYWLQDYSAKLNEKTIAELKAKGIKFHDVENIQEWIDAATPLYQKYGAGYEDLIVRIQAVE